jgi:hypothetical protein
MRDRIEIGNPFDRGRRAYDTMSFRPRRCGSVSCCRSFWVLVVAAVLIGGRSILGPHCKGDGASRRCTPQGFYPVYYAGRHFLPSPAYDNKTAELTKCTVIRCPEARPHEAAHAPKDFAWGDWAPADPQHAFSPARSVGTVFGIA